MLHARTPVRVPGIARSRDSLAPPRRHSPRRLTVPSCKHLVESGAAGVTGTWRVVGARGEGRGFHRLGDPARGRDRSGTPSGVPREGAAILLVIPGSLSGRFGRELAGQEAADPSGHDGGLLDVRPGSAPGWRTRWAVRRGGRCSTGPPSPGRPRGAPSRLPWRFASTRLREPTALLAGAWPESPMPPLRPATGSSR